MRQDTSQVESRALKRSIWGALGMAALAVLFAFFTSSEAILLDGLFSSVSFGIALASLHVSRLVQQPSSARYQFGYASFEPFLNMIKGLIIIFLSLLALFSAIDAILKGGSPIATGLGMVYAIVAAVGCIALWALQRRDAKSTGSPLVEVDAHNWLMDGIISGGVAITFLIAVLLEDTSWGVYLPYLDPGLTILLVLGFAPVPVIIVRSNLLELLRAAPDEAFQQEVEEHLNSLLSDIPGAAPTVRAIKTGRQHYLLIHILLPESHSVATVAEQDQLRERLDQTIQQDYSDLIVDMVFTQHSKWVE